MAAAASVNAKGWALFGAAERGHAHGVALELLTGAPVNWQNEYGNGWTALINAAAHGHVEVVRLLLDRGAELDIVDSHGQTALMLAAYKGQPRVVLELLRRGADPDLRNGRGQTARDMCMVDSCRQVLDDSDKVQRWRRRRTLVVWARTA